MNQKKEQQKRGPLAALGMLGVIGTELALTLLIGLWIGKKVDSWVHTAPIFMIVGMFLGLAAGIWSAITLIKPFLGDKNDR